MSGSAESCRTSFWQTPRKANLHSLPKRVMLAIAFALLQPSDRTANFLTMLDHSPRFDLEAAERLAREHFGVDGRATPLTSERDQNFLIESAGGARRCSRSPTRPRTARSSKRSSGARASRTSACRPRRACSRTVEWRDARRGPGDDGRRISPGRSSGSRAAARRHRAPLAGAIRGLRPPAGRDRRGARGLRSIRRFIATSIGISPTARAIVARYRSAGRRRRVRRAIDALVARFDRHTAPLLASASARRDPRRLERLQHSRRRTATPMSESRGQRITGIVDFGDMVHSYRVADLAIAMAYVDARRRRSARRRRADRARLLRADARSTKTSWPRCSGSRDAAVRERVHRCRPTARSARQRLPRREPARDRAHAAAAGARFRSGSPRPCSAKRPACDPLPARARGRVPRAPTGFRAGARRRSADASRRSCST